MGILKDKFLKLMGNVLLIQGVAMKKLQKEFYKNFKIINENGNLSIYDNDSPDANPIGVFSSNTPSTHIKAFLNGYIRGKELTKNES